jgi:hypothetical protein
MWASGVGQQVPGDEDGVADCNQGVLLAAAAGEPVGAGAGEGLGPGGGDTGFAEGAGDPRFALAGGAGFWGSGP